MPNFNSIVPNFYSKTLESNTGKENPVQKSAGRRKQPGVNPAPRVTSPNVNIRKLSNVVNNTNRNTRSGGTTMVAQTVAPSTPMYSVQSLNPSTNRLNNNNLPSGGSYSGGSGGGGGSIQGPSLAGSGGPGASKPQITFTGGSSSGEDTRVKISDPGGTMGGKKIIFPYNPVITVSHRANYELENLVHSTYSTPYFTHSSVDSINVQGRFTAQNQEEAQYVRDMIQFFRTATKMFYGASDHKGAPPPVVQLEGYGDLFEKIPVVVRDFSYTFPNDVNYISAGKSSIPTDMTITIDLLPVYSRNYIESFSIGAYFQGGGNFI